MKRYLLIALAAFVLRASAQTTSITASSVSNGSRAVTGTLCLTAVDARSGSPIPITKHGGGYYGKGGAFCGTLAGGALVAPIVVPDSATDSAPGHAYAMTIYDSSAKTSSTQPLFGVTGTTFSLDNYQPPTVAPTTAAFTFTSQPADPVGSCTAPALWDNIVTNTVAVCGADNAWHSLGSGGVSGGGGSGGSGTPAVAPVTFGGGGVDGATATVTTSGTTAILSNGTALAGLSNSGSDVGKTYGPFTLNNSNLYLLLQGCSHTFQDPATSLPFSFSAPVPVTYTDINGNSVTGGCLYESGQPLFGTPSVKVIS